MSIKEEFVEVVLNGQNIKHFEKLGYPIPRRIDSRKELSVKQGTKILVKVSDLPKNSNTKITAICECPTCKHPERILRFSAYTDICRDCYLEYLKSQENRLKHSGKNNPNWNKHHSEETKRKMKKNSWMKGKKGLLHPSWNPNKTDEEREFIRSLDPGYKEWAKKVKEKDNFKCVVTGCTNTDLESHHKDNWIDFPEKRYDLDNGIILCIDHHRSANGYSFHTIYGKEGNIKEQYDEWIDMFKDEK